MAIGGNQWQSKCQSVVISGNQWQSKCQSVAISGNQWVGCNKCQSEGASDK
jgi:hypothetical protein